MTEWPAPIPVLLDLFCGAGGAAMGYHRAGFDVVGVDIEPQPSEFIQADALEFVAEHGREFDAIHASPPCLYYTRLQCLPWVARGPWRSIPPTREAIRGAGLPYVIENVADAAADMFEPITLCGQMFGLPVYRHRCFEVSPFMLAPVHEKHRRVLAPGHRSLAKRHHGPITRMGIDWMTSAELGQAIPPAYTEFIGKVLSRQGLPVRIPG